MNEYNLTPYSENDGRTEERIKGGLISGYKRLQKSTQADVFNYLMLKHEIDTFIRQNQNRHFGKKRTAKLKQLAHRKKILENRMTRNGKKIQRRKEILLSKGIEL